MTNKWQRVAVSALLVCAAVAAAPPMASAASTGFSGTVFNDRDWDGIRDPGEGPLSGVILEVVRKLEPGEALPGAVPLVLATATSGSDGRYAFSGLPTRTKFTIRVAQIQPLHIDSLGFNGMLSTTFLDWYRLGQTGSSVMQDFHDIAAVDIGASRYHKVNIETWVDTNHNGKIDDGETPPAGYTAELLNGNGATIETNTASYDSKTIYFTINEASAAYAVRAKSSGTETAIVSYDSDGNADGDIVINRSGGRTPPNYQVTYTAASHFGTAITGCTTAQPAGWAIDAVANDATAAQVWRLYSAFLLRQPEQQGFNYWLGIRRAGNPHTVVAESFALATEFANRYGPLTDSQYVQLLYKNVLCRKPDTAGYNYWLLALRDGLTRGEAMLYFSEGNEYLNRTGTTFALLP